MQILDLLGMYFDAVVVFRICKGDFTLIQIGSGHTVLSYKNLGRLKNLIKAIALG